MRDYLDGSRLSFGHCIGGEPTGDETPLYLDDEEEGDWHECATCARLQNRPLLPGGLCLTCHMDRRLGLTPAPVYPLHPARRAA